MMAPEDKVFRRGPRGKQLTCRPAAAKPSCFSRVACSDEAAASHARV